ncbi:MAG: S41 family peptidase [Thermomicrobiales bacterium]
MSFQLQRPNPFTSDRDDAAGAEREHSHFMEHRADSTHPLIIDTVEPMDRGWRADPPARKPGIGQTQWYLRLAAVFLLVLLTGAAGGMLVERNILSRAQTQIPDDLQTLDAVDSILVENYYYRPSDPAELAAWENKLEQQAIAGMLGSLDDTYTRYLEPADAETAANQLAGSYEGVGITYQSTDKILITEVAAGGPAEKAGIKPGDVLVSVDGRDVVPDDDVRSLVLGESGTTVTLGILRSGSATPVSVPVVRGKVIVPPVSWKMLDGTSIAYLRIDLFGDQTTALVTQFLHEAEERKATGVILDLRSNGGGWVKSAQEVIGRFVNASQGPALYEDTSNAAGGEVAMPILNGSSPLYSGPLVVLVDGATASAAEIVAGSLKDYNRALIVGRQTYGKGSVQRIFSFQDGSSMRVTVAEWLTPSRGRIQDVGVQPNVPVTLGAGESDPDIAQGIALLQAGQNKPSDLAGNPPATPVASPGASPTA